jgi:ferritin
VALSKTVQDALNEQMKQEFYAAYLYLSMSSYCSASNFEGFAKWLRLQAQEEVGHAMRIYDYLEDRGGRVLLQAIPQPATEFPSILSVFEQARDHERKVTAMINRLYEVVDGEKDYASHPFLEWFLTEQIEEEKQSSQIVETLKLAGDHPGALLMLDREMGARGPEEVEEGE